MNENKNLSFLLFQFLVWLSIFSIYWTFVAFSEYVEYLLPAYVFAPLF